MDSAAPPQRVMESFDRNAAASEGNSEYLQSVSSESSSFIMVQPKSRLEVPSRMWVTTVVVIVIVLQVASTTGLFIYLNMSMAQVKLHATKSCVTYIAIDIIINSDLWNNLYITLNYIFCENHSTSRLTFFRTGALVGKS